VGRAATAAGYEHVFVRDAGPATRDLLGGTGAVVLTTSTPLPPLSKRRIVVVAANVVPQSRWLRALLEMPIEPERLYVDGACAMAIETERAGEILRGATFFLSPAPAFQVTGALLLLTHSVLDGCDGELARLKFQQSRVGAMLDYWGDNVVHVAVFVCIAIGWALSAGTAWPLGLGAVA